jgi:acylphosphatase
MKRLTAYVSGQIQKVGYRARVLDMARLLGLKGTIQNLADGRVKVIAEGEENDLERFLKAINIKNTIIHVSTISNEYSEATGDFDDFYKQVGPGETDSRLDQAVVVLKEILVAIKGMDTSIKGMDTSIKGMDTSIKGMDTSIKGMDTSIKGMDTSIKGLGADIVDMNKNLGDKIDVLGCKIDDTRADVVGEIRELRKDIKEDELVRVKNDIAEIKAKLKL